MNKLTTQALEVFYARPANLGAVAWKLGVTQQELAKALVADGVSLFGYDGSSGHVFALREGETFEAKRRQLRKQFGGDFPLVDPDYVAWQNSRGYKLLVPAARPATKADYVEACNPVKTTPVVCCDHEWNGPYTAGTVRYCTKCASKQTN